jgi:hypothetical protein
MPAWSIATFFDGCAAIAGGGALTKPRTVMKLHQIYLARRAMQWMLGACFGLASVAMAQPAPAQLPLIVIGASYGEGATPFNNGVAPLGGIAVSFGSYRSLGAALARQPSLPGHVVNEAQAGASTFARLACGPVQCGPAGWDSYETQLSRALARVTNPFTVPATVNAKYVVITMANDCLHSDAAGIPQSQTAPCSNQQLDEVALRLVQLGQSVLNAGLTPIFDVYPSYDALNLPLFRQLFGLVWVIRPDDYNYLRSRSFHALSALPGAVVLDMWQGFEHRGDGLHPTDASSDRAARRIAAKVLTSASSATR